MAKHHVLSDTEMRFGLHMFPTEQNEGSLASSSVSLLLYIEPLPQDHRCTVPTSCVNTRLQLI